MKIKANDEKKEKELMKVEREDEYEVVLRIKN